MMMRACDVCKKRIPNIYNADALILLEQFDGIEVNAEISHQGDLCPKCYKRFLVAVSKAIQEELKKS